MVAASVLVYVPQHRFLRHLGRLQGLTMSAQKALLNLQ